MKRHLAQRKHPTHHMLSDLVGIKARAKDTKRWHLHLFNYKKWGCLTILGVLTHESLTHCLRTLWKPQPLWKAISNYLANSNFHTLRCSIFSLPNMLFLMQQETWPRMYPPALFVTWQNGMNPNAQSERRDKYMGAGCIVCVVEHNEIMNKPWL